MRSQAGKGLVEVNAYDVHVERDGRYWLVRVPAVDRATQARNLREVDAMARDLVESMTDEPAASVELKVRVVLPNPARSHFERYAELAAQALALQLEAAAEHRAAARDLAQQGLTYRDIGGAMGISHQRAEQLVKH